MSDDARGPMEYEMDDYAVESEMVSISNKDWQATIKFLPHLFFPC